MKALHALLGIIFKNTTKYDKLKSNDEKRYTSRYLGGMSIFSTILGAASAVLCICAIVALISNSSNLDSLAALLSIVGIFLLIVLCIGLFLQLFVNGLVCAILQMKLNKKPIGLISLILWCMLLVAAIIVVVIAIF